MIDGVVIVSTAGAAGTAGFRRPRAALGRGLCPAQEQMTFVRDVEFRPHWAITLVRVWSRSMLPMRQGAMPFRIMPM
ncbi:hypothetical protein MJ575_21225 [Klebsiella pneumoniae]|nr:hypothetical protein MJ575_21225 [Klebsiella pneumoniae]